MTQHTVKFPFSNKRGETLAGLLDMPQGEPLFYGVFAPCFTCTKESHAAHKISRALSGCGIAMLRFDLTGLGESEGRFADTNFSTRILDIVAAGEALANNHHPPKLLIGHSISGTASLAAAASLPSLQALATLGSPADPAHVVTELRRLKALEIKDGEAEMLIAGRRVVVGKQMVDNMESSSVMKETAAAMAGPNQKLFIFHAPHDEIVSFRNAQAIFDHATGDREIIPLRESATHLLERGHDDANFIAETLHSWFNLHLQD